MCAVKNIHLQVVIVVLEKMLYNKIRINLEPIRYIREISNFGLDVLDALSSLSPGQHSEVAGIQTSLSVNTSVKNASQEEHFEGFNLQIVRSFPQTHVMHRRGDKALKKAHLLARKGRSIPLKAERIVVN